MKIFVSYAARNREVAEEISLALLEAGHDVFFDRTSLPAGRPYHIAIRERIRSSALFVFVISRHSLEPGTYALTELDIARGKWRHPRHHVLPVVVDDIGLDAIPPYLRSVTILSPRGNVAAEVAARVGRPYSSRTRALIAMTLLVLGGTAAYVAFDSFRRASIVHPAPAGAAGSHPETDSAPVGPPPAIRDNAEITLSGDADAPYDTAYVLVPSRLGGSAARVTVDGDSATVVRRLPTMITVLVARTGKSLRVRVEREGRECEADIPATAGPHRISCTN